MMRVSPFVGSMDPFVEAFNMKRSFVTISEQSSRASGECEGAVWSADRGSKRSVPRVRSVCLRRCDDDRHGHSGCVEGAIERDYCEWEKGLVSVRIHSDWN